MAALEKSKDFDDIDEAEEEALLKSDDENESVPLNPKATLSVFKTPAPIDDYDDDSLMREVYDTLKDGEPETEDLELDESGNSSDDDDDDDDESVKVLKEYCDTLKDLEVNQFAYDKYVRLCELAHITADLDNIRNAYKVFSNVYPLSPELWSKYLSVEQSVAQSEAEIEDLIKLYKQALNDYYSIDLALEMASLVPKSSDPLPLWQELLGTYALNCLKGKEFFHLYRKYLENSSNLPEEEKEQYFIESFLKELRLPLWNMEESFIEFKLFVAKNEERLKHKLPIEMKEVESQYYQAKEDLQKILVYERQLESLDPSQYRERFEVYLSYIKDVDKYLNENILQTVYERMVADCCLNDQSWLTYIDFIEYRDEVKRPSELQDYPVFLQTAIDINRKALRNCVWSDKLYIKLMLLLEAAGKPRQDITAVLESSMSAGFHSPEPAVSIWLEYLTYLRRHTDWEKEEDCEVLRKNFDYAWNYLSRQWSSGADSNLEILKLWGRLEYGPLQDPVEGKAIWNNVMGNPENASRSGLWIEFAQLELRNDLNSTRHLYRTALQKPNLDNPFVIASAWERFERCNGSIKTLKECKKLCQSILETYSSKNDHFASKKAMFSKKAGTKRKANDEQETIEEKKSKQNERISKKDEKSSGSKNLPKERAFKDHETHDIDLAKDHLRIFLSNLDYNLSEDDIREGLPNLKIVSVDLIRSANGKSRGFGYLELESPSEVAKALKLDGSSLKGRPLYVSSVLRDKEQRQKFKYSDALEPKKLFVKGLPNDTTKEELESLFGTYGKLLDVRLVYHKSGKFKNIAYVEFQDEPAAGKSVLALNNTDIRGHTISVAISAPPPKPSSVPLTTPKLLGFNPKRNKLGEQKPRMSLIPNVVRKKFSGAQTSSTSLPTTSSTTVSFSPATSDKSLNNGISSTSKSNEDFRKLLMK